LMLIASVVGEKWEQIYETAKTENYRFLSYGDSSILFRSS
jgi:S-adenosylmethionine:tRNA ribosyltransferase-isomerase